MSARINFNVVRTRLAAVEQALAQQDELTAEARTKQLRERARLLAATPQQRADRHESNTAWLIVAAAGRFAALDVMEVREIVASPLATPFPSRIRIANAILGHRGGYWPAAALFAGATSDVSRWPYALLLRRERYALLCDELIDIVSLPDADVVALTARDGQRGFIYEQKPVPIVAADTLPDLQPVTQE